MVQGLPAKVPAQAGVWVEVPDAAEAEWADHLPQDQVVVVYVRAAGNKSPISSDNPVINKPALSAVRE
ncbi:MAG: hypothetical protein AMJ43_00395 [Coxiella sp. DG_40]|nr:MAG: hypothetical protein AMJ43_00395 [Coxiella sp. DG_40]